MLDELANEEEKNEKDRQRKQAKKDRARLRKFAKQQ